MKKVYYLITTTLIFVTTLLFFAFVFLPSTKPTKVVSIDIPIIEEIEEEEETPPTLEELWQMEESISKKMPFEILNRELPNNWLEKDIYFKYTYLGEYDEDVQKELDDILLGEYRWQNQFDEDENILLGGAILKKDNTFQLHTHNTFTHGTRFFLLGDLLDKYASEDVLEGMQIRFGNIVLECEWVKDIRIVEGVTLPYSELLISTCMERYGNRRLISGWKIVRE